MGPFDFRRRDDRGCAVIFFTGRSDWYRYRPLRVLVTASWRRGIGGNPVFHLSTKASSNLVTRKMVEIRKGSAHPSFQASVRRQTSSNLLVERHRNPVTFRPSTCVECCTSALSIHLQIPDSRFELAVTQHDCGRGRLGKQI